MENNWDNALIEILNSLSKSNPHKIYIIGSNLADIIYLKFKKKNVQIKSIDQLLTIMENIVNKADPKLFDIINFVQEKHILEGSNIILNAEKHQRWINFKKICKICKKEKRILSSN
jgi:hypothetical protein